MELADSNCVLKCDQIMQPTRYTFMNQYIITGQQNFIFFLSHELQ